MVLWRARVQVRGGAAFAFLPATRSTWQWRWRSFSTNAAAVDSSALYALLEQVNAPLNTTNKYLSSFRRLLQQTQTPCFAVIKVGGEVVEPGPSLDSLARTCLLLHSLGLKPIVIHGGGPQMNDELKRQGVEPQYIGGHRVTDQATLDVASSVFTMLNARVVEAINAAASSSEGGEAGKEVAVGLPQGVFRAQMTKPELGFVGQVMDVETTALLELLQRDVIPVLTSLGEDENGQVLNINADVAAREMAVRVKPLRVVFTSAKGGWIDEDTSQVASVIDMNNEFDDLASRDYEGRQGTYLKLVEIKTLLDNLPEKSSVAITAADSILEELFTDDGGGTLFVKGPQLNRYDSIGQCDLHGLQTVLQANGNEGFGMEYFQQLQTTLARVYTFGDPGSAYSGAAVVKLVDGKPVLDAFHVDESMEGMDCEILLWKALMKDFPTLAWRLDKLPSKLRKTAVGFMEGSLAGNQGAAWAWKSNNALDAAWDFLSVKDMSQSTQSTSPGSEKASSWSSAGFHSSAPMSASPLKVGLLGARGYVGRELAKLLVEHPDMELRFASSRALVGQRVIESFGLDARASEHGIAGDLEFTNVEVEEFVSRTKDKEVDIWVLALPNNLAPAYTTRLYEECPDTSCLLIDLSADFRFDDSWVYGLPERPGARAALHGAKKISNPGCYATGIQVALMPLLQPKDGQNESVSVLEGTTPMVFGVSGYSGAGTTPSPKNDPHCLGDNLMPYTLTNHIHEREATRHLGHQVAFTPHVASWFQGIHLTATGYLSPKANGQFPSAEEVAEVYEEYFREEPLVEVYKDLNSMPHVRDIMFQHGVKVGGFDVDPRTGRVVMISLIDNLLKGAATQALQNINIALGKNELLGIKE